MNVQAILFDVGDTLLRVGPYEENLGPRIAETVEAFGVPAENGALVDACSRAFVALRREILQAFAEGVEEEHDLGELLVRLLAAEGVPATGRMAGELGEVLGRADVARLEPTAGVVDVLAAFRDAGYRLAAVSNTTTRPELLNGLYERVGLLPCMEHWVYSVTLGVRKPHPAVYQRALDTLGVDAREVVFVGDRVREDVLGPRRAGIAHAVLTHEYRQEDPGESSPCGVITRLEELHALLPRLK